MPFLKFTWNDDSPKNLRSVFDACIKSMQSTVQTGSISLVLKGERPAHQTQRFLAGPKSPKGEIIADLEDREQLVSFKVLDLLAWMTANGFCRAEQVSQPQEAS